MTFAMFLQIACTLAVLSLSSATANTYNGFALDGTKQAALSRQDAIKQLSMQMFEESKLLGSQIATAAAPSVDVHRGMASSDHKIIGYQVVTWYHTNECSGNELGQVAKSMGLCTKVYGEEK